MRDKETNQANIELSNNSLLSKISNSEGKMLGMLVKNTFLCICLLNLFYMMKICESLDNYTLDD